MSTRVPPKSIQIGRLGVTMSDEPDGRRARGMGLKLAYDTIRDEILSLKLPPGQLLDETTLADRFGKLGEVDRLADVAVGAAGVAADEVLLFLR